MRVLGPPEVLLGGSAVRLETRKALAVLAYLTIEGPQRRDTLDALLWPESDAKRARGALRRTLTALRRALPDGVLADGDDLAIAVPIESDLQEADALLARVGPHATADDVEALTRVDRLHRGTFLDGLSFRDAVAFDDWRLAIEEQARRRHAGALERLCQALVAAGELEAATDAAERRLQLDPLHEPSHQQLMLLHAWRGDRTAATEQYRSCVRVLDRELGVAPLERTTTLYRAVLAGTVPTRQTPVAAPTEPPSPHAGLDRLPLVGREPELRVLRDAHDACHAGGRLVGIRGEAGIGKSRLVDELAADVAARGGPTVTVTVDECDRSIAYAPVAALLRELRPTRLDLSDGEVAELARLLPELGPAPEAPVSSPGALARFTEVLASTVVRALGSDDEHPGLLVIDDAHHSDRETRALLGALARRLSSASLLVVLTWRAGADGQDDVERLLPEDATRIDLARLGPEDVSAIAAAAKVPADAEPLYSESEGVPYLVVSYLAARRDQETWELPPTGRELVRTRVAAISEVATQVLAAAAVLGRSAPLDLLAQTSGRSEVEVVDALDELTARGLLAESTTSSGGVTYTFTHDKIRAVVHDDTSLARRRLLHGRAADALARTRHVPAAALARHLAAAGRETDAADAHARAGRAAADLYANAEAVEHLEAALGLGHPHDATLLLLLGDALVRLGRYVDAADRYTRAASRGADAALVDHRLGQLRLREGDPEGARTHLERALRGATTGGRKARVRADVALAHLQEGALEPATHHATAALALAESSGDHRAVARARNLLGVLGRRSGDVESARDHLVACLQDVGDDADARTAALNNLALVQAATGDRAAAVVTAEEALAIGRELGDRHREAALLSNLADLLHASGRTEEALGLQREAAERFAGVGDPITTPEIWQLVDW